MLQSSIGQTTQNFVLHFVIFEPEMACCAYSMTKLSFAHRFASILRASWRGLDSNGLPRSPQYLAGSFGWLDFQIKPELQLIKLWNLTPVTHLPNC
jgi:hypothetical protein